MTVKDKTLGGVLLIAGTAIGAGMLALPITTGGSGFFPSVAALGVGFGFMLLCLFLLLEANLTIDSINANVISMAKERLGVWAQVVAWFSFLFLMYAAAAAYMSGGGSLVAKLSDSLSWKINSTQAVILFAVLLGGIAYGGTKMVDYVNRFLMFGLIIAYVIMVIFVLPNIKLFHLTGFAPHLLPGAMPVVVLSFTTHIILPSLRTYLDNDLVKIKRVLYLGSLVPLAFYLLWQLIIIGLLPMSGEMGLAAIGKAEQPVRALTEALHQHTGMAWIVLAIGAFSFCALVTSFLAVILSIIDFLADGLTIRQDAKGRLWLVLFALAPPLFFALYYPSGFVLALGYGGVCIAILYGILPALMVWKIRYHEMLDTTYRMPGGKPVLVLVLLGSVAVVLLQISATLGWLS